MKYRNNAPSGKEYSQGLQGYLEFIQSNMACQEIPARRLEHQFECLRDWSLFYSVEDVRQWFINQRRICTMHIEEIPLNQAEGWAIDPETGNIAHESGEFFRIHGVRVNQAGQREVYRGGWDQPILTQVGFDGGFLGLLCQRFEGIPHYLVDAKAEPGNHEKLQLSPTLQATFSNLKRAHKGRKPHFASYFEEPEKHNAKVIYRQWLSEDGGRLYLKRNMGMLVEISDDDMLELPDSFIWLSMFQIKSLLLEDAWINPHIRGIIAHL